MGYGLQDIPGAIKLGMKLPYLGPFKQTAETNRKWCSARARPLSHRTTTRCGWTDSRAMGYWGLWLTTGMGYDRFDCIGIQ